MPATVRTTKTATVSVRGDHLTLGMMAEAVEAFADAGASDSASVAWSQLPGVYQFSATWQIAVEGADIPLPGIGK